MSEFMLCCLWYLQMKFKILIEFMLLKVSMNVNDLHAHFKKLEKSQQSNPRKEEGFLFYLYTQIYPNQHKEKNTENLKSFLSHKENMYCLKFSLLTKIWRHDWYSLGRTLPLLCKHFQKMTPEYALGGFYDANAMCH